MDKRGAVLALASAAVLAGGCGALQRPEIRAVRPHVTGLDVRGVSLTFEVDIHTPYPLTLRTPRFQYAMDIEDGRFIESQAPVEVDLPARQVGTVMLPVRLDYAELWRVYRSLASAREVNFRLHGVVPISALGQQYELPLSHSGTFPVFHLPEITLGDVDFSDVSLSKASATAVATIRNPNAFALGAEGLGCVLLLGDVPIGHLSAATQEAIPAGGTGTLQLTGEVTARSALGRLLQGGRFSDARLSPRGRIQTPYGPVSLER